MDVSAFCTESRVLIVAGKGGVGKTTVTAALARMAARASLSVLVVELEGKPGLNTALGGEGPLEYDEARVDGEDQPEPKTGPKTGPKAGPKPGPKPEPKPGPKAGPEAGPEAGEPRPAAAGETGPAAATEEPVVGGTTPIGTAFAGIPGAAPPGEVRARRITPDDALLEYLADHGLRRVSRRLVSSGVIDVVATAIPGIRDVLVLGKIKQLERDRVADLIVVDAPATGHAVTFLTSASGLLDAARGGPVRSQAADVVELLSDPRRCRVMLVTLPEEMPVSETIEAAYQLEDKAGVQLGPVVVNGCDLPGPGLFVPTDQAAAEVGVRLDPRRLGVLEAARQFRLNRHALQRVHIERLARELPLPQLVLPELMVASIGPSELDVLAAALEDGVGALEAEPA